MSFPESLRKHVSDWTTAVAAGIPNNFQKAVISFTLPDAASIKWPFELSQKDAARGANAKTPESSRNVGRWTGLFRGRSGNGNSASIWNRGVGSDGAGSVGSPPRGHAGSNSNDGNRRGSAWEDSMRQQLAVWHADPEWEDEQPKLQVSVPKGSFCRMDAQFQLALPPDLVYSTLCDPSNRRVFKNITDVSYRNVLYDDGDVQEVELQQGARWRFLFLSGTFDVRLRVKQDRPNLRMSFRLIKPGFMKQFEGHWQLEPLVVPPSSSIPPPTTSSVDLSSKTPTSASSFATATGPSGVVATNGKEPAGSSSPRAFFGSLLNERQPRHHHHHQPQNPMRVATTVQLCQVVQPALSPPPILSHYLRGISTQITRDMLKDFQTEAARIRYKLPVDADVEKELERIRSESGMEEKDGEGGKGRNAVERRENGVRWREVRKGGKSAGYGARPEVNVQARGCAGRRRRAPTKLSAKEGW
ncbi:hypothetical protein CLOM_g1556 [Closterium sp. NIES-68]|nr:hypothetical protein CLOM_g1556 [Closterium sp. NIES-68]GJP81329.1 hypothetical protein CLOP_g11495 [Closterium sp. NIES-67]